jgi:predicted O-methyltransferase YrrM
MEEGMPDPAEPSQEEWTAVDEYVTKLLVKPDAALETALQATAEAGMPAIAVSAPQGKFLALLAQILRARRILEMGTLGGYSTIWMARALPADGRLISLEVDPRHAKVASANLAAAGVDKIAEIRVGPALETLPKLADEGAEPFDLVFIDADKANIPAYFDWSVRLSRPGTVIVVDNVVRNGALLDASGRRADVVGVRRLHEALSSDDRVSATTLQTVGTKGYDGFTLAVVGG